MNADLQFVHDVLHNCRGMLSDRDAAHAELGRAMGIVRDQASREPSEKSLRDAVSDVFRIGSAARDDQTILMNATNAMHRSGLLSAIERTFFTKIEKDEDGWDSEECSLNSWGSTREEYIEQFRAALATREEAPEASERPDLREWTESDKARLDEVLSRYYPDYKTFAASPPPASPTAAEPNDPVAWRVWNGKWVYFDHKPVWDASEVQPLCLPPAELKYVALRAKGVLDADDNLDCWDTPPFDLAELQVKRLNEKDSAACWRVAQLYVLAAEPKACPECGGSLTTWKCTCSPIWPGYAEREDAPAPPTAAGMHCGPCDKPRDPNCSVCGQWSKPAANPGGKQP